jgi:hypothetical protein
MDHGFSDGEYSRWETKDLAPTALIDGGDPTSNTHVIYSHARGASGGIKLQLAYFSLQNRSSGPANVGIGVRIPTALWKAGSWVNSTTTYTDDTPDFQSVTASDAALETLTNNDGFIVSSTKLFNALCINVGTASVGVPVRVLEYSSGTSTWTAITNYISFAGASAVYPTGENVIVWIPPANWAVMAAGHGTGVTVGHYGIRIRATTASATAGVASSMSVHRLYFLTEGLADNNLIDLPFGGMYFPLEPSGEALVSYISTVNNQNRVSALLRSRG